MRRSPRHTPNIRKRTTAPTEAFPGQFRYAVNNNFVISALAPDGLSKIVILRNGQLFVADRLPLDDTDEYVLMQI